MTFVGFGCKILCCHDYFNPVSFVILFAMEYCNTFWNLVARFSEQNDILLDHHLITLNSFCQSNFIQPSSISFGERFYCVASYCSGF